MRFITYRPQPVFWSSFDRLPSLRGWLDSTFDPKSLVARFGGSQTPLDIYETAQAVTVRLEAAGFKKEDFEISLQEDSLGISGERRGGDEGSSRATGRFSRTVTLPRAVSPDGVTARYEDGVLTITLPKAEEGKPRRIEVDAK